MAANADDKRPIVYFSRLISEAAPTDRRRVAYGLFGNWTWRAKMSIPEGRAIKMARAR